MSKAVSERAGGGCGFTSRMIPNESTPTRRAEVGLARDSPEGAALPISASPRNTLDRPTYLHLETDASLNPSRVDALPDGTRAYFAGGGIVLRSIAMRLVQHEAVPLGFVRSAIEAEALAFLAGMGTACSLGAQTIRARSDSAHLVGFLKGTAIFREPYLLSLGERLQAAAASVRGFQILWSHSHHGRTRGDGVPSADYLARVAAGLETRSLVRRRRRRAGTA